MRSLRPSSQVASAGRRQTGSVLVELALVLPLLLLLALGVGFVGRVFYHSIIVNNAARAGAGYGMRNRYADFPGMKAAAVADATQNIAGFTAAQNVPTATFYCKCPGETPPTCGVTNSGDCWSGGSERTCSGYGETRIYVEVDTTYTFNSFGTDSNGNAIQVCLMGNCLPSTIALNGCSIMRAR